MVELQGTSDTNLRAVGFWQGRSVAVTGATGFLGSHVVSRLLDAGAQVVVLVRDAVPVAPIAGGWLDRVTAVGVTSMGHDEVSHPSRTNMPDE